MKLVYFARVRETLGRDGEDVDFPADVKTVSNAIEWLVAQSASYAEAFADRSKLRFALDQRMVKSDASISGATEFAIFPPVTGG